MNRQNLLKLLFTFLLFASATISLGQNAQKQLLLGNWTFVKFEFTGDLADVAIERQNEDDLKNKGLTIILSSDNKFQSVQKGGMQTNNVKGSYKLIGTDKLVILGDTCKIIQLDTVYLKLYSKGRPTVVFKK